MVTLEDCLAAFFAADELKGTVQINMDTLFCQRPTVEDKY